MQQIFPFDDVIILRLPFLHLPTWVTGKDDVVGVLGVAVGGEDGTLRIESEFPPGTNVVEACR